MRRMTKTRKRKRRRRSKSTTQRARRPRVRRPSLSRHYRFCTKSGRVPLRLHILTTLTLSGTYKYFFPPTTFYSCYDTLSAALITHPHLTTFSFGESIRVTANEVDSLFNGGEYETLPHLETLGLDMFGPDPNAKPGLSAYECTKKWPLNQRECTRQFDLSWSRVNFGKWGCLKRDELKELQRSAKDHDVEIVGTVVDLKDLEDSRWEERREIRSTYEGLGECW